MNIEIVKLDKNRITETKLLLKTIFSNKTLTERFSITIYNHKDKFFIRKLIDIFGYKTLDYWVAVDTNNNKLVGTTGLYSMKSEPENVGWLGWFCVHPDYRNKGIGNLLLDFIENYSRKENKAYLKLYTADVDSMKQAQILYEKRNYKIIKTEKRKNYNKIYREKTL